MTFATFLDFAAVAIALLVTLGLYERKHNRALPPGPRGWPLIGNVFDVPKSQPWKMFAQWGDLWGDMVYMNYLGQPIVILNSARAAREMLEKKGAFYSDRPVFTFLGRMVGWDNIMPFLPYGPRHRESRRLFAPVLGSRTTLERFIPLMEYQISRILPRLIRYPNDIVEQVLKTVTGVILSMAYGYRPQEENDRFVQMVKPVIEDFSLATSLGAFLVDSIPLLRYVPAWMPGANWKKSVTPWRRHLETLAEEPFAFAKEQMASGKAAPSFAFAYLQGDVSPDRELLVKMAAASIFSTFFVAMLQYPNVLKKAQQEIDTVIGTDRIPRVEDRDGLPYVNALVSEVYRWHPPVPLGMPHRLTKDDVHAGYFLPKGTIVKMLHDPEVYADPFTFNPDRFLSSGNTKPEPDPREVLWGFGRRICPGQHPADTCIYLILVKIIATFDIVKLRINGVVDEPPAEFTTGTVSRPKPFNCVTTPRSAKAEALIHEIALD
ncbi:cytochrome P450 [Laetiporus sulphureus 93-53]|uniref:Cytochrome P450 n=1 Tax=Laetiporus sulphureus 93-53 TaxID=1314785 RepID=A0A165DWD8_9APHY|nr:cytochrome P450 [Laetiporus sulphureus 93-53]KZT05767.1 cytochrome P450 [Laetiporus sulphureus 93-53]